MNKIMGYVARFIIKTTEYFLFSLEFILPTLLSFTSSSGNTHILLIPRFTTPPLVLTETTRTLLSLPLCSSATRPQDHCNGGRLSSFTITMSPTERSCFASFHLVRCCS
ncbi:hypothetical protein RI129_007714 [Pyrocoelia pectoralis]|uniref:Uncharacterized protein n=1 Tax=Pyrocoelia pectoralis TaxID=417401 RepID=A0AAN7VCV8_9COLE